MKHAVAFLFAALVAASSLTEVKSENVLEQAIRGLLESLRGNLTDLHIEHYNYSITSNTINGSFELNDMRIENLDKFYIEKLQGTVLPIRLNNLTLTLNETIIRAGYGLDVTVALPGYSEGIRIHGNGNGSITLRGIFFTVAISLKLKDFKPQIPPGGISKFDFSIREAVVDLENLMGGGEPGYVINKLLSFLIPELIRDYKQPVFEAVRDPLIDYLNKLLAGANMTAAESDLDFLDRSEPIPITQLHIENNP